jgi:hypothetical protein
MHKMLEDVVLMGPMMYNGCPICKCTDFFYLNVYWTHLKLQAISFKVWHFGSYSVSIFSSDQSSTRSHFP